MRRTLFRLAAPVRRVANDNAGATAVEFALVLFPFLLLLGSIVEVGIMQYSEYTLQNAVQEASRKIQTGQMEDVTVQQFKLDICNGAAVLKDCPALIGLYVQNADDFTALAAATPPGKEVLPGQSVPFEPGVGRKAVAVIATYDWTFSFPFMDVFNNAVGRAEEGEDPEGVRRLQGIAVFQNEAFSDT